MHEGKEIFKDLMRLFLTFYRDTLKRNSHLVPHNADIIHFEIRLSNTAHLKSFRITCVSFISATIQ